MVILAVKIASVGGQPVEISDAAARALAGVLVLLMFSIGFMVGRR